MLGRNTLRAALALPVAALVIAAAPMAAHGTDEGSVVAKVDVTNHGPLPSCAGAGCADSTTWFFIRVANTLRLTNTAPRRDAVPNSFVVESVDMDVAVDGTSAGPTTTWRPPPNITPPAFLGYAGRWPATVTCGGSPPPCSIVGSPAILPGERTTAFYVGWIHADGERNGNYRFTFTVHGSVNGEALDLVATSPTIPMTP